MISIDDFQKVDIRIGTVIDAIVPAWSHWVIKLTVDFGEELGVRTIFTGMLGFYKPEEFVGQQFAFVTNLEPKRIGPKDENGEYNYSQGMLMAPSVPLENPEGENTEKPVLMPLQTKVPNGTKVR